MTQGMMTSEESAILKEYDEINEDGSLYAWWKIAAVWKEINDYSEVWKKEGQGLQAEERKQLMKRTTC